VSVIWAGEDRLRVTGLEDAAAPVVVRLDTDNCLNEEDLALAKKLSQLEEPPATPLWLGPLLLVVTALYVYALMRVFDATVARLLP
jgi:hypothetical protein